MCRGQFNYMCKSHIARHTKHCGHVHQLPVVHVIFCNFAAAWLYVSASMRIKIAASAVSNSCGSIASWSATMYDNARTISSVGDCLHSMCSNTCAARKLRTIMLYLAVCNILSGNFHFIIHTLRFTIYFAQWVYVLLPPQPHEWWYFPQFRWPLF